MDNHVVEAFNRGFFIRGGCVQSVDQELLFVKIWFRGRIAQHSLGLLFLYLGGSISQPQVLMRPHMYTHIAHVDHIACD